MRNTQRFGCRRAEAGPRNYQKRLKAWTDRNDCTCLAHLRSRPVKRFEGSSVNLSFSAVKLTVDAEL